MTGRSHSRVAAMTSSWVAFAISGARAPGVLNARAAYLAGTGPGSRATPRDDGTADLVFIPRERIRVEVLDLETGRFELPPEDRLIQ